MFVALEVPVDDIDLPNTNKVLTSTFFFVIIFLYLHKRKWYIERHGTQRPNNEILGFKCIIRKTFSKFFDFHSIYFYEFTMKLGSFRRAS